MELSCGLALARTMVKNLDLPSRSKDGLSALLVTPAIDWLEQVRRLQFFPTWLFICHSFLGMGRRIKPAA